MKGKGTRPAVHIAERRYRVAKRYLQGENQFEIAAALGVDQSVISRDLKAMHAMWLEQIVEDHGEAKVRELARIAHVEAEAWRSWARSQEPREITTTEQSEGGDIPDAQGQLVARTPTRRARVRREGQVGQAVFLATIQKCIDQRVEILGLKAPTHFKVDLEDCSTEQLWRIMAGESPERVMQEPAQPMVLN